MFKRAALLVICCLTPLVNRASAAVSVITTCPFTITQPGQYYLTHDLSCSNKISINANHVDLFLNGRTIACRDAVFPGVEVSGTDVSIIGAGTITGCAVGVSLLAGNNRVFIVNVTSCRTGIAVLSNNNTLMLNQVTKMQLNGVVIAGSSNTLRGNLATDNGLSGLAISSGGGNLVALNRARNNGSFDASDSNPACGSDTWRLNDFGTENQTCIK
jgi:parallel beta-helix repeat protein